jgi:hypothetical protein
LDQGEKRLFVWIDFSFPNSSIRSVGYIGTLQNYQTPCFDRTYITSTVSEKLHDFDLWRENKMKHNPDAP